MNKEIKEIQRKVVPLLKKYGVVRAGIFGSYARGEQKKKSDLDLLIEVKKKSKFSLFDLVGLEMKLEQ
ncbi:MAG: nucleotidyltransferase domain-containing protein, partial [Nanoarchaeota archaeon]|nr:nucleotidyltransferase domain-containing protein [Nanoarchaeota archaeon]